MRKGLKKICLIVTGLFGAVIVPSVYFTSTNGILVPWAVYVVFSPWLLYKESKEENTSILRMELVFLAILPLITLLVQVFVILWRVHQESFK